jgi:hypothetical protein
MNRVINKIMITAALACCSFFSQAQSEGEFPLENLSISFGLGAYPYGLESVSVHSNEYLLDPGHTIASMVGISYHLKEYNVGLFAETSLGQKFRSVEWIPFDVLPIGTLNHIHRFYVESNGFNIGVLIGNEVLEGLELYGKLGVGTSYHDYEIFYTSLAGTNTYVEKKTTSINYQLGLEVKYYPFKVFGFSSSLSFSDNFPVYSFKIIGKFADYKKSKE